VLYRFAGPDSPVPEQAADDAQRLSAKVPPRQQIGKDAVVVAGVESDILCAAGVDHTTQNIHGLVTIEGSHLDGNHIFNLRELALELVRQQPSADQGLKIKANHRNDLGYRLCMVYKLIRVEVVQATETEEHGVVTQRAHQLRLFNCL